MSILLVAFGLKLFFISGDFICPLTVPHLSVNALTGSGAVIWVRLSLVAKNAFGILR